VERWIIVSEHARILVVDDEETLRNIVSRALAKLGHECVPAASGEEAFAAASKQPFDLVITDLKMPGMGGLGLIENLRKDYPALPIIIVTGYADVESARKALRLRVADYLVKPFESLAEVQSSVQRALDSRTSRADTEVLVREFETRARSFDRRERSLTQTLERAKGEIDALAERLKGARTLVSARAAQLGELIENLENGILVTDAQGLVLSLNRELRRQLQAVNLQGAGLSVDRLPGDSALRAAMIESRNRLRIGNEEPVSVEVTDRSGEASTYEVRSAHIPGQDDDFAGVLTTVRPVRNRSRDGGTARDQDQAAPASPAGRRKQRPSIRPSGGFTTCCTSMSAAAGSSTTPTRPGMPARWR